MYFWQRRKRTEREEKANNWRKKIYFRGEKEQRTRKDGAISQWRVEIWDEQLGSKSYCTFHTLAIRSFQRKHSIHI